MFDQAGRCRDVEAAVLAWEQNRTKLAPNGVGAAARAVPEPDRAICVPLAGPIAKLPVRRPQPDLQWPAAAFAVIAAGADVALVAGAGVDAAVFPMSPQTAASLGAALIRHAVAVNDRVFPPSSPPTSPRARAARGASSTGPKE
ncbi:MAG: hypothetical protein AB7H93_16520 [Vicinamibacterales bacterium]